MAEWYPGAPFDLAELMESGRGTEANLVHAYTGFIMAAARGAGADLDRLQADMNSAEVAMIIERTRAAAQQLNISGTPSLVIGTQVIPGAIGIDEMRQIIAAIRAENG